MYQCPNCHGGFDDPATPNGPALPKCPWCGTAINGEYDPERFERVVTRVKDGDEGQRPETPLERLMRFFT